MKKAIILAGVLAIITCFAGLFVAREVVLKLECISENMNFASLNATVEQYSINDFFGNNKLGIWEETWSTQGIKVVIGAEIVIPEEVEAPVVLAKKKGFHLKQINEIVEQFTSGALGSRELFWTKEEMEELLLSVQRGQYEFQEDGTVEYLSYEGQDEDIEAILIKIENTPDVTYQNNDMSISDIPQQKVYYIGDDLEVYVDCSDNYLYISSFSPNTIVLQHESWITDYASPEEPFGATIDNVKVSESEAREQANELFQYLGFEDIEIINIEKARLMNQYLYEELSKGWIIVATNNYAGGNSVDLISLNVDGLLNFEQDNEEYNWRPETISVYIDENGIQGFFWTSPVSSVKTLNSNIQILNFDDIKSYIKSSIEEGINNNKIVEMELEEEIILSINKLVFSNIAIRISDKGDYCIIVPAWIVFYDLKDEASENDEFIFVLNALDGSVIDIY